MSRITYHGLIFNEFERRLTWRQVIRDTLYDGASYAEVRTPVRTGRLMLGWDVDPLGGSSLYNDTFYAGFVESGTRRFSGRFMLYNSLPQIQTLFEDNILNALS